MLSAAIHRAIPWQSNMSQRLMSPYLTCLVLHVSLAGSCVPMLRVQSHGFSTLMCRRDYWFCIIIAPIIYENALLPIHRTKKKAQSTKTGTKVLFCNTQKYLATLVWLNVGNCVHVCNQACNVVIHMSEACWLGTWWVYNTCIVSNIL